MPYREKLIQITEFIPVYSSEIFERISRGEMAFIIMYV